MPTIYEKKHFKDRDDYIDHLIEEVHFWIETETATHEETHITAYNVVNNLADLLGPNEDFDGLVYELADYCQTDIGAFIIDGDQ